jgi:two-component sensor histidine kinase
MTTSSRLSQAIFIDIDSHGRLVHADPPLMRLHLMAGGELGGLCAIPTLLAMASATHRMKMRLARAVRVADDDNDIEMWVESRIEGGVVRLAVLGWQEFSHHANQDSLLRDLQIDQIERPTELHFDTGLRLISVAGKIESHIGRDFIGVHASQLFPPNENDNKTLLMAMHEKKLISVSNVSILGFEGLFSANGYTKEKFDYIVELRQDETVQGDSAAAVVSSPMFGAQLGPVLRQPLGRIIANAETISSKLQGPIRENYATYAKDIADAARHLVALVDDLGDLEAVERQDFATAKDNIELGDIARRVAGLLALKAADHQIKVIKPDKVQLVPATAEFRRVLQIMINLLTNAIRYAPDGSSVRLIVEGNNDWAYISVQDEGPGIAAEDQDRIFNKFERLGRSGDGGSGLGLYISRRLAMAMGGDLTINSSPAHGTKFTLKLPR